jgi:molybdopterin converting factor small subunit
MPQITVNVYANLREFTGGAASVSIDVDPGQTVADVLDKLGVPRAKTKIIFVDSRAGKLEDTLAGKERIDLFSAIGGG